jgi:uncharacterized protein YebE (UPF0316 family)
LIASKPPASGLERPIHFGYPCPGFVRYPYLRKKGNGMPLWETPIFQFLVLPFLIFLSRIFDVSIGTIRIITLSKGLKKLAPLFGFFEVLIWLLAIRIVLANISNPVHYVAYAAGFSAGTWIGMIIEERLAIGNFMIRIVTRKEGEGLISKLRGEGFRVIDLIAHDNDGEISVIFSIIQKKDMAHIRELIERFNPRAFYTVEDIRFVSDTTIFGRSGLVRPIRRRLRKGK